MFTVRPDPEKFSELRNYLVSLGLKVAHPEHVKPRDFAKVGQQLEGRADKAAILMAMLRALPQAEYTPTNIGHFGLALDAYAHFTSPIRRYPDLLVHRAIRHLLRGGKPRQFAYDLSRMERLGGSTSTQERRAEEATREVEALLKCQFMEDKIGRQYDSVITGVTNFGVFVQLPELMVDGLLHVFPSKERLLSLRRIDPVAGWGAIGASLHHWRCARGDGAARRSRVPPHRLRARGK